jgi:hypothetical protein
MYSVCKRVTLHPRGRSLRSASANLDIISLFSSEGASAQEPQHSDTTTEVRQ